MSQDESLVNQEDISYTLDNNPDTNRDSQASLNFDGSAIIPDSINQDDDTELSVAAQALNDFDELCELVQKFELEAFETKKKINLLDKANQSGSVIPSILKMCFTTIKKLYAKQKPDFDDKEQMEKAISDIMKLSCSSNKDFSKFKGEYFSICEPIINKDISLLKISLVTTQSQKKARLNEKMEAVNENSSKIAKDSELLKDRYDAFQKGLFQEKFEEIQQTKTQSDEIMGQINSQNTELQDEIKATKEEIMQVKCQSQEQRKNQSEMVQTINKIERRLKKWQAAQDKLIEEDKRIAGQVDKSKTITEKQEPQPLSKMIEQTKEMTTLFDCYNSQAKFIGKIEAQMEEVMKIQADTISVKEMMSKLNSGIKEKLTDETQQLMNQINAISDTLTKVLEEQDKRLDAFEERLGDIKISDADQFYLNKEIMRFKNSLNAIDSTRDLNLDSSKDLVASIEDVASTEQIESLRKNLKQLNKLQEQEMPKTIKNIDNMESFVMKSLKNQLNDDNKKSQSLISKVKKNYDELQRMYEASVVKYGDSNNLLHNFHDKFDYNDMERLNEINILIERLREEGDMIGSNQGASSKSKDESMVDSSIDGGQPSQDQMTLHKTKRSIIQSINTLVSQFNENNKLIKDGTGKSVKSEATLNELISKNKDIQDQSDSINQNIEDAKQLSEEINTRLFEIVNQDVIDELTQKYNQKNDLIDECQKLRTKASTQSTKLIQTAQKQADSLKEILEKLEQFNPINSSAQSSKEFLDQISTQTNTATSLQDKIENILESLTEYNTKIEESGVPLSEVEQREVSKEPEIEDIKEQLNQIIEDLLSNENIILPQITDIAKLLKTVKELLDEEVDERLTQGQKILEALNAQVNESQNTLTLNQKKIKFYKELIDKSGKGQQDTFLLDKLAELQVEDFQIEKDIDDHEQRVKDLKKKKTDAKKVLDEITKNTGNFTVSQIDNLLNNLDDIQERANNVDDKLNATNALVERKIQDLEALLQSSSEKRELVAQIQESSLEVDDDLNNLGKLLEKLPGSISALKRTILEMKEGTNADDDYNERKEEIEEMLAELDDMVQQVDSYNLSYEKSKEVNENIKKQAKKSQSLENLKKIADQLQVHKDTVSGHVTDALDAEEALKDLQRDLGDCDIPLKISKRKAEFQNLQGRIDRMRKEMTNLKKATKNQKNPDQKIEDMIKEVDFKLKGLDKDSESLLKSLDEFEKLPVGDFEDLTKNPTIIKNIRKLKANVEIQDTKLKEIEETQNEVVKKLTEQDLENSADLLGLKAQELRERLQASKKNLQNISKAGEDMDGNTSNKEEDEFIDALKAEMPEVFENIETTLNLLLEIEKLVGEVKKTMSVEKMTDLKEKVNIASENVEESESLVQKLEKEIVEWNAQKKLCRRDQELDEIKNLTKSFLEDLTQEQQNTEIELEKNQEKQDENRDQEMVDKDGNKVDIMEDLVKLETQMKEYLVEIKELLKDVADLDARKETCLEGFSNEIPKSVKEVRKRRHAEEEAAKKASKTANLKRPPQLKLGASKDKDHDKGDHDEQTIYKMVSINCKYKQTILKLLKDLKQINKRRKDLEDRYSQMRAEVFKIKQIKLYKPVAGDVVDEMFAGYLNKAELTISVQRLATGKYMFGTKQILAKIINGKLVIRVGGGYMNAEEFIDQYGEIEMRKLLKLEEMRAETGHVRKEEEEKNNNMKPRKTLNAAELKAKLKDSLMKNPLLKQSKDQKKDLSATMRSGASFKRATLGPNSLKGLNLSSRNDSNLKPRGSAQIDVDFDLQEALNDIQGKTPTTGSRLSGIDKTLRPQTSKYNSRQESGPSSPVRGTPQSARKSGLNASGLNFKGLVSSNDHTKSPKASSMIGEGLKNATSSSTLKPESKSKIGFGTNRSNMRSGLTPRKGGDKKE